MTPFHHDPWLTIHGGDCRDVLATMPDESVHMVVTSPPYWNLRDYGVAGQLGLEPTPQEYVDAMVGVFREVRRVLRPEGTLWLNLGDSYAGSWGAQGRRTDTTGGMHARQIAHHPKRARNTDSIPAGSGLKPKDLVGIPWRVAFALQADGWYLRSDIIWAKPNPMPESVTDRPTKSHEYLFLLAKSERYYFDADAVREESTDPEYRERGKVRPSLDAHFQADPEKGRTKAGLANQVGGRTQRNIRSVWTIATQPYPGSHFAVFPPKLVEPCILAGTSERGVCAECGSPWRRVVEREVGTDGRKNLGERERNRGGRTDGLTKLPDGYRVNVTTTGWQPTCDHAATTVPATVLDPFGGSGTTAMVAQHLSRRAVLIDLNPEYIEQQLRRANALPMGL